MRPRLREAVDQVVKGCRSQVDRMMEELQRSLADLPPVETLSGPELRWRQQHIAELCSEYDRRISDVCDQSQREITAVCWRRTLTPWRRLAQ